MPSNDITLISIVTGVLVTIIAIVALLLYCIAKKNGWFSKYSSSSRTTNQHDPESLLCEPVSRNVDYQPQGLCENMQDAEFAQVVKMAPEIGKTTKLYQTKLETTGMLVIVSP